MDLVFTGPRRRKCGCLNLAHSYHSALCIALLIPLAVLAGVEGVVFTEAYASTHSADGIVQSVYLVLLLSVASEILLFLVVFTDPGILEPGTMTPLSHMCPVCLLEVDGFDHHCYALSACIGRGNYKYFLSFTMTVTALCLTGFVLALDVCKTVAHQEKLVARITESWWRAPVTLVKVFTRDKPSAIAAVILALCTFASWFGLVVCCLNLFYTFTGRHSLHRRRRRCVGGGFRDVYSDFFRPKFTDSANVARYRDGLGAV